LAILSQMCVLAVMLPLLGVLVARLANQVIGQVGTHRVIIGAIGGSCLLAVILAQAILSQPVASMDVDLYAWAGHPQWPYVFYIGILLDPLTVVMMVIVTIIALLVHIYSIGYMADDPGYRRFFSMIAFFTFAMLCLVTANNFLQLFIGWEAVGLASYLLIGFWNKRPAANRASLKAFLVNRIGDVGFLLGIALVFAYTGSVHYQTVFAKLPELQQASLVLFGQSYSVITVVALLLFVGAMGKSAQIPLHVWLPESMEGPTPISALIHAATMVTAGIFMVIRLAPWYEYSEFALSWILIIGATGALGLGLVALVVDDIKRVIAFSTLSQLGYMVAALGVSAYSISLFHLCSHAFFKALLFLAAGSVIISLHHEQDMHRMGGLKSSMPWVYWTYLIGGLALCAVPPFSGFYSKDIIIAAIGDSERFGATYAYSCVCLGALITPIYLFRSLFLTFHGTRRYTGQLQAVPWTMQGPLLILAVPSIGFGLWYMQPMLFEHGGLLNDGGTVPQSLQIAFADWWTAWSHAPMTLTFWFTALGIGVAWLCYCQYPHWPERITQILPRVYRLLVNQYGFNQFNDWLIVRGSLRLGHWFTEIIDRQWIDARLVDGSGQAIHWLARQARRLHTGALHHYIGAMMMGVLGLILWLWLN